METLYRKHRPQTFADLIGQEHVRTTLQNQLKGGSLGHAYLFTGPRGVGKTTTARLLAKAVNCLNRGEGSEPCNVCEACREVIEGRSLDVIEMDAASHTGVDNVRENIIENVRFAPALRAFKVFIIDEVHMLSDSAFNALLKTLEEPPAHALFILATTEIHKVPETIVSRTQRFDFRRIRTRDLVARLARLAQAEGIAVEEAVLEEIARHSEGSQRDAESLLAQVLALGEKKITMEIASLVLPVSPYEEIVHLVELLAKRDAAGALLCVDALVEEGVDLDHFTKDTIRHARELFLARLGGSTSSLSAGSFGGLGDLPETVRERSVVLARALEPQETIRLIDLLQEATSARMNIPQLPLEMAIVKFCSSGNSGMGFGNAGNSQAGRDAAKDADVSSRNIGDSGSMAAIGDEIPNPTSPRLRGAGRTLSEFVPDRDLSPEVGERVPREGSALLAEETSEPPSSANSSAEGGSASGGEPPTSPAKPDPALPDNLEPVSKSEIEEVILNAEIALPEESNGHVTFKTVQGKWEEVFEKVAQAHTSLGFLLKTARLIGVEGNEVRLGFDFKFHADTMNAAKNRDKLESVLQKIFGSRMRILGEYVHADADEIVGDVMEELGGRVVE